MSGSQPSIERDQPGRDNRLGLIVRMPFHTKHEEIREQLKGHIQPPRDRYWFEDAGAWWVAADHEPALMQLLLRWWGAVQVLSEEEDRLISADGTAAIQGRLF